jgi:hypothetical protein
MVSKLPITPIRLEPVLRIRALELSARRGISLSALLGVALGEYVDVHLGIVHGPESLSGAFKVSQSVPVVEKPKKPGPGVHAGPSRQQRRAMERAESKGR